ncbi:caprin-2 [Rhinophrynus dorsalis]
MVQFSPSSPKENGGRKPAKHTDCQESLDSLQSSISSSATPFQAYETYIDNGLICLKHKIRNIEKKKVKLEDYRERLNNGEILNPDQQEAVEKYDEVIHNLEFARELHKTFSGLSQDLLKAQKKALRRENLLKIEAEKKRLRAILQVQYVLQSFSQEHVQKDFKEGLNGAMYVTTKELDNLVKFSKLTCPKRFLHMSLEDQMDQASIYFWNLLEGAEKTVAGTNYKYLKDLLTRLLDCGYFESVPDPPVVKPKQEIIPEEPVKKSEIEKMVQPPPTREPEPPVEYMKCDIHPREPRRVPPQTATEFSSAPSLPKDPELRKQKLQDLIDQIKGKYNFMQESILDFTPRTVSPALPPEHSPPELSNELEEKKPNTVLQPEKASQMSFESKKEEIVCEVLSEPEINEPVSPAPPEVKHPPQTPLSLPSELPSPKTPTNTSVLQLQQEGLSLSPRANPVSMNSSPFQGMQTVFKVNVPLPSRQEPEVKDEACSQGHHQTFTTASTQTLPHCHLDSSIGESHSLIQEPLTGSPYASANIAQMNSGSMQCYTSTPNILPRMTQPYVSSRGSIRGTSRGGRIITNGYRCPTGYKGPESFRGPPCIPNGSYGHAQCPGREYPTTQFISRDGTSHLCQKRGANPTTSRTNSRGWSESSQTGSPEREDSFNSVDSGQGESRSMTSLDISLTNQSATILPVHVYPLPQQMRVAFSAARTSNFAPGTLDQPIVFDLLLNNLGDTFDFQAGRFMCPVNGTYVFIFHMLKLAVNVPLYVNLMKNEEVLVSAYANDGAPDHETASNHAVLQLFQGDQIWLRLHRGAIYGSSWKYSTFSGYLLYQD